MTDMKEMDKQEQRLVNMVEAFKEDSEKYKDLETPRDAEGRRRVLRSLMNVCMPVSMPQETLKVQDEYHQAMAKEKGIVTIGEIPAVEGVLSIWQGVSRALLWMP